MDTHVMSFDIDTLLEFDLPPYPTTWEIERLKQKYKWEPRLPHPRRGPYKVPYTFFMTHNEALVEGYHNKVMYRIAPTK